jgi:hypothetical protein
LIQYAPRIAWPATLPSSNYPTTQFWVRGNRIHSRFPVCGSGVCSLAVDREALSLFFPDIELSRYLGNACAAALFDILGRRIAVFFEKDPDIGPNNRETGSYLTAHTTIQSYQTADFQAEPEQAVSVGIFASVVPLFRSPVRLAVSQGSLRPI